MNYQELPQNFSEPEITLAARIKKNISDHNTLLWQLGAVIVLVSILAAIDTIRQRDASLTIDFGNKQRMFQGEVIDNMTVVDALTASAKAGHINFTYAINNGQTNILDFGAFSGSDLDAQILFYLNARLIDTAKINEITIRPKDKITVKIAPSQ